MILSWSNLAVNYQRKGIILVTKVNYFQ